MDKANKIVSYVKQATRDIDKFGEELYSPGFDFLGCSTIYVEEKVNALIFSLQQFKKQMKAYKK